MAIDRVRHPNIISRLGHGTAIDLAGTTFHYIVLEYLSGGDMAALSRNHALPIEKVLFYLEQVCSGLAHAHACGVIHRDIKPQNLLLTADRQVVKIADFGVARLEATEGAITRVRDECLFGAGAQSAGADRFVGPRRDCRGPRTPDPCG